MRRPQMRPRVELAKTPKINPEEEEDLKFEVQGQEIEVKAPDRFADIEDEELRAETRRIFTENMIRELRRASHPRSEVNMTTGLPMLIGSNIESAIRLAEMERSSLRDSMTGLYSDAVYEEEYKRRLNELGEKGEDNDCLLVLSFDVDNFKSINDNIGHDYADDLLRAVGKVLRTQMRVSDIGLRSSQAGDEFIVLLHNVPKDSVDNVIQRYHNALSQITGEVVQSDVIRAKGEGKFKNLSLSMGALVIEKGMDLSLEKVKYVTEEGLKGAKNKGKNAYTTINLDSAGELSGVTVSQRQENETYQEVHKGPDYPVPQLEDRKKEVARLVQRLREEVEASGGNTDLIDQSVETIAEAYYEATTK